MEGIFEILTHKGVEYMHSIDDLINVNAEGTLGSLFYLLFYFLIFYFFMCQRFYRYGFFEKF